MAQDKTTSRRSFMKGSLAFGLAAGLGGMDPLVHLAHAAEGNPGGKTPKYYVFVYFSGAWDILLSLDPRDPMAFNAGNAAITKIQPAYNLLDDPTNDGSPIISNAGVTYGPYMGDLMKHTGKLALVRGMSMDTLTHEVGRRRFITGKPPSGLLARGASAATWLAATLGQQEPIPNLSVRVETYNVDQPNYASGLKVASVPDLVRALKKSTPTMDSKLDALVDQMLKEQAECQLAQKSHAWQKAEQSRIKSREMVTSGFDSLFDFQAKTPAMEKLRDHYGIAANGAAALQSPEAQAAMAATALTAGISRVVSFTGASGLDTHFDDWQTDQGPRQERGFNSVARLVEDLEAKEYKNTGSSWMDHTVIVGFSEFSRTAMLNSRGGRDHSLTNACFVMGAGIKGDIAVGKSTDIGLNPGKADLATGLPSPLGEIIKPEHVLRTLLHDAGQTEDVADLRVEPLTAILK